MSSKKQAHEVTFEYDKCPRCIRQIQLSGIELKLFLIYLDHTIQWGHCRLSAKELAKKFNCSTKAISEAKAKLGKGIKEHTTNKGNLIKEVIGLNLITVTHKDNNNWCLNDIVVANVEYINELDKIYRNSLPRSGVIHHLKVGEFITSSWEPYKEHFKEQKQTTSASAFVEETERPTVQINKSINDEIKPVADKIIEKSKEIGIKIDNSSKIIPLINKYYASSECNYKDVKQLEINLELALKYMNNNITQYSNQGVQMDKEEVYNYMLKYRNNKTSDKRYELHKLTCAKNLGGG